MAQPTYMNPFVLPVPASNAVRDGSLDVYRPEGPHGTEKNGRDAEPLLPAIIFVHGGPVPPEMQPRPRDWPVFAGYGSLAAAHGVVGVVIEHGLVSTAAYADAAQDVVDAAAAVRALPGVDPERVALWFFSGAGMLTADWIRDTPSWLRCIAASYPLMAPWPGMEVEARFRPTSALAEVGDMPLLVTRVGQEQPVIAVTVDEFIAEAHLRKARLDVIEVPDGHHSFDIVDDTDASRAALVQAMEWVTAQLQHRGGSGAHEDGAGWA